MQYYMDDMLIMVYNIRVLQKYNEIFLRTGKLNNLQANWMKCEQEVDFITFRGFPICREVLTRDVARWLP